MGVCVITHDGEKSIDESKGLAMRHTFGAVLSIVCLCASKSNAMPPVMVETYTVTAEQNSTAREAIGTLQASESVMLRSEISGRVTAILFEEGRRVAKGAPLIRLDDSVAQADVLAANADVRQAGAALARQQGLKGTTAFSRQRFDEASAAFDSANARKALAAAQQSKTVLRAPFDADTGLRHVSPGAMVQPGQDLVLLVQTLPMNVDFHVAETQAGTLQIGQAVSVLLEGVKAPLRATLQAIDPAIDPKTRTLAMRAVLAPTTATLRSGGFAKVHWNSDHTTNAVRIPESAVVPMGEEIVIFVVNKGVARAKTVTLGERRAGEVVVERGLNNGDVVITAGQQKIQDGAAVQVSGEK
jgi:membrane fusion protein, multidrug efflux system